MDKEQNSEIIKLHSFLKRNLFVCLCVCTHMHRFEQMKGITTNTNFHPLLIRRSVSMSHIAHHFFLSPSYVNFQHGNQFIWYYIHIIQTSLQLVQEHSTCNLKSEVIIAQKISILGLLLFSYYSD